MGEGPGGGEWVDRWVGFGEGEEGGGGMGAEGGRASAEGGGVGMGAMTRDPNKFKQPLAATVPCDA